ncbi:MAG: inner membrane-spanning protein YciB, partial [Burkholderiaceae bacterium]
ELFIKWKPTVLYWCFSMALLGAQLILRKNLIRSLMGQQMTLPDPVWGKLNLAWGAFFAAMGVLNLYVAFNFPLELWVNFKMFGFLGLMIAFVIAPTAYLSRYLKEPE